MLKGRRRQIAAGLAAAAAIVLGGSAALAASGSANPASSFLGDVAKKLGISEEKLTDAIKAAQIDRIDAAVARGDITKEQGDELKERVRSGGSPAILPGFRGLGPALGAGPKAFGFGFGFGGPRGFRLGLGFGKSESLQAAADYLGMTQEQLRDALANGKSLADVARDKGKSVDGLEDAMTKPVRAKIDQAVKDGSLTKEQGDQLDAAVSKTIDSFVNGGPGPLGLALPGLGFGLDRAFGHHGGLFKFGLGLGKGDVFEAAADYLGMSEEQLRDALRDGKTPAQIAKDKGKSVDGLKNAVKKSIRADVDQAVEKGLLTKEQGDRLYDSLSDAADNVIDNGFGRLHFELGDKGSSFHFEFRMDENDGEPVLPPRMFNGS